MNRPILTAILSMAAAALLALPAARASADSQSEQLQVKIKAPLDAAVCDVTPQTIMVLGLTIDVTHASFDVERDDESEHHSMSTADVSSQFSGDHQGGDEQDDDDQPDQAATCADLLAGQTVQVKLASDVAPLVATAVEQDSDSHQNSLEIRAPIQALDAAIPPTTIMLLGLLVDISSATTDGCDDEDDGQNNQPIDPTTLMIGQFVDVKLDRNLLPALVARDLEVKKFANAVEIDVEDASGNDIDDLDDDGRPMQTVTVDVTEAVRVVTIARPAKGSKPPKASKGSSRILHFQAQSNGHVVLHGLPPGAAKVSVTRSIAGATAKGRGSIAIAPNSTTSTTIRLKGGKVPKSR